MAGHAVGALSMAVGKLQASMGEAYGKLTDTLKQNLSIMQSMNECMEFYMTSGLALRLESAGCGEEGTRVRVVAEDKIKFPIKNVTFSLTLHDKSESESESKSERIDASVSSYEYGPLVTDQANKRRKVMDNDKHEENKTEATALEWKEDVGTWSSTAFDLMPGESKESIIKIRQSYPKCYALHLTASFPSPGTGNQLQITSTLHIPLLAQLKCTWCGSEVEGARDEGDSLNFTASVAAKRLREVFSIPEKEGIQRDACGTIATFTGKTVARLTVLPDEDAMDRVQIKLKIIEEIEDHGKEALRTIFEKELQ
ncbi:hypothetical protein GUITHDRAFT_108238 [Guillardia theta CCMP2712]|uniref:Uncharacterized protein n=2 Tax=Guillardia theta TaxID=55529 RepID=L1JCI6_GUITC|nr:hypothetical protein GUITHDRAFT_108238 [Guillardia theta CCMP2712]EKX45785.1 hypothetical protein GUITHDRAFT_108238 [Guillardia theta CCMP2712]|eukprot:XP_005832765.1 hypothetical protein GUITHDRAFT_108238 [Guillardia theta CCMP2712]